jgi:F0F1-type ATP synthase epsilon subunit
MAKIKLVVRTHQGKLFDEECDYIVVKGPDGEFAIFPNHVSVITSFEEGFIKFVLNEKVLYLCVSSAIVEFSNNVASILAQEAHIGETMKLASEYLNQHRKERLDQNRKLDADLAMNEKELIDNIKMARAGNI